MITRQDKILVFSLATIFLSILSTTNSSAQLFEIEGQAKIMDMVELNNCDSVVVRASDGTLAIRHASTLGGGGGGSQTISIREDTIFLSNGGNVKLPPDAVNDSDSDPQNELQILSLNGDTLFIENGNYVLIPGLNNISLLSISVQEKLNRGANPLDIYRQGYPLDSIYGKFYQGGYIFYLDPLDTIPDLDGMVATDKDQNNGGDFTFTWGCAAPDSTDPITAFEIGTGAGNTFNIDTSFCSSSPDDAAAFCAALSISGYDDWYLPSIDELQAMYDKIGQGATIPEDNIAGFRDNAYWSSSDTQQGGEYGSFVIDFFDGSKAGNLRDVENRVRAVRSF